MSNPLRVLLLILLATSPSPAAPPTTAPDIVYLDNTHLRLGIKLSSGAAICHLSSPTLPNVIDSFDRGRLVQQSYYGSPDGSRWANSPWRWNPVQGGDYTGHGARVLEFKPDGPTRLYAKTLPKHWATGADLPDVTMEQWITLADDHAHVHYRLTYTGTTRHPDADQETPAIFLRPDLATLVLYDGPRPWTGAPLARFTPGWPNQYHDTPEHWAAYLDPTDHGLGAYVPTSNRLTCYRYHGPAGQGDCSYFAPLGRFPITPNLVFDYDLYLALGSLDQIRTTFTHLHQSPPRPPADATATQSPQQTAPPSPPPDSK